MMQLTHLQISEFQQFRTPFEIRQLAPGINLFTGPNESGKSTLVRAIRAAFLERHKSGTLTDLQPWGDSSASPEVSVAFDWQGQHWQLHKRFLQRKRCDLQAGDERYQGDEAEDQLARLLGYETPARGASKEEHWGVPGLLWVEQGAGQHIREPARHASEHLQSALSEHLGDALGEVISSGGDQLIQQVEQQRSLLLTQTGKPTGELRDTRQACENLLAELASLEDQVAGYRDQVDHLGALWTQQLEIDTTRPWEAQRKKAQAAEAQLADIDTLRQQQEQARQALENCERNQEMNRQQLREFAQQAAQLENRQSEKHRAEQQLIQRKEQSAILTQQRDQAKAVYEQARRTLHLARENAAYQHLQDNLKTADGETQRLAQALEKARELQQQWQTLGEKHQAQAVDAKGLGELRELEKQRGKLMAQKEMLATRLSYTLLDDQHLVLDEHCLEGSGEQLLLETAELAIPGVGTLTIQPGGKDVNDLLRQQQRLEDDRDALIGQLQVADLAEAERKASAARELAQQLEQVRLRLKDLALAGVETLANEYRLAEQRREAILKKLVTHSTPQEDAALPTEAQANHALEVADAELTLANQAYDEHQLALKLGQQALESAEREWQALNALVHAPDRQQREQSAHDLLLELKADARRIGADIDARQRKIDAANPAFIEQDIKRFRQSAETLETQARERASEIDRLQTRLETLGAQGLEEKRDTTRQALEYQQRRKAELERRAEALELLLTLLRDERQAVTRKLQAPLQKHLNHYLQLMFPGATLSVDDNLLPQALIRPDTQNAHRDEQGELESLSFGAREQMGLISRLAYADLLREAGRPTLIILDDALVHCDHRRLEQMKRMLFDAAERHQILLFTCHPSHWDDLGVAARDLPVLKMAAN
ncbi:AAA family ATPase [Vreelandella aquamarina]